MKVKISLIILFFSFSLISEKLNAQKKIEITLIVDVDSIDSSNLDQTCSFGQPADISNEDYTTGVSIGDEVKWKVEVKDGSKGSAKLSKFKHDNGKKFFNKDTIGARSGKIKGKIESGSGSIGDTEKYTLEFEVKKKNGARETFSIDPKLKLMPRE